MNNIVFYQKRNGEIFLRPRKSVIGLRVGEETSMGWKVLNILYECGGNYYTYLDYCKTLRGKLEKRKRKKRFIRYLIRQLNRMI